MIQPAKTPRTTLPVGIAKVLKRLHYPLDVILLCVRWYVAYSLSLRDLEEMMAERGIAVGHSTVHRWVIKLLPLFEKAFRRHQRPVADSWRMDETYILVKGRWKYLYRAVDKAGANLAALQALNAERETPIKIHLNNLVEQDHRGIKRRVRPMLGFQTFR
ncbi:IS6 family transposase, partial [Cupriavidus sp. AcVe19-1a]|uniref:IS6 family transposase n=1 Tax=Cupriavidus sp. AcVe19-1a TaxID=2821359 RepID=UPI001AE0ED56